MTKWRRWLGTILSLSAIACGGNAPPAAVPNPAPGNPAPERRPPTAEAAPCSDTRADSAECLAAPLNRARRDSAAKAFARGFMPLGSAGVPAFAAAHPDWDGRGVLIAILDSGIDPGIPGLVAASDGTPKILDLRDFSGEGSIRLQPAATLGDTIVVGRHRLLGAARVRAFAGDSPIWGGALIELRLGKGPAADVNGNGFVGDTLPVVVAKTANGWAVFADTRGTGSVGNERPIRDFLVAHETFGWIRSASAGSAGVLPSLTIAVNLSDSAGAPRLDLFFDTFSHGTLVSGVAAGHNMYGVPGFDGVAPGAKLIGIKIANDANGGTSVTGAMVRALDYAIAFAHERAMPLVVNLSFGVGNEREGTARIDAMIDSILALHPDVVMTIAAGNDGPGLSTLGFPGSASRALSVGATLPASFVAPGSGTSPGEQIASFSGRGGEIAGPDLVLPGVAYSTVPNFAVGDELQEGTSFAAPYAAGLAARLIDGLRASGLRPNATLVRQSLHVGARSLPSGSAIDQGSGLPDLSRSWQWLSRSHDFADLAIEVGSVTSRGAVYLTANPAGSPGRPLGARVIVRRVDGTAPLTLRLRTDAAWLHLPEAITLVGGRGEFTVAIEPNVLATPGTLSAAIRLEGPDETAGPLATVPVTVRIPVAVTSARAPVNVSIDGGAVRRVFFAADTGQGIQVEIASARAGTGISASLHEPGGMPFRDGPELSGGNGDGAGLYDIGAEDVSRGSYEVVLAGEGGTSAAARVTVRSAPVRLHASLDDGMLRVTAQSLVTTPISVRLRAGLIGAEQVVPVRGTGDGPIRVAIAVPSWADHLIVDTRMAPEQWSRFTDFGVSFFDRRGRLFDASPINYAISRARPELPDSVAGDTIYLVLSPGFADSRQATAWSIELAVRFYLGKPYALDGDGWAVKALPPGTVREERFTPGPLPVLIPPGFRPLVTVVALEGKEQENIWTRQVAVGRPAGVPK